MKKTYSLFTNFSPKYNAELGLIGQMEHIDLVVDTNIFGELKKPKDSTPNPCVRHYFSDVLDAGQGRYYDDIYHISDLTEMSLADAGKLLSMIV